MTNKCWGESFKSALLLCVVCYADECYYQLVKCTKCQFCCNHIFCSGYPHIIMSPQLSSNKKNQYHQYSDQYIIIIANNPFCSYISCIVFFSFRHECSINWVKKSLMQGIKYLETFWRKTPSTINHHHGSHSCHTYQWSACIFVWFILFIKKLHKISIFFLLLPCRHTK